jgi:hypothetical protein
MMRIAIVLSALATLLLAAPGDATPPKISGTIVSVDPEGKILTVKEIGIALRKGKNREIQWQIVLGPDTRIALATRATEGGDSDWPGRYLETPITARDLKPGDFATVEADIRDGKATAISVVVAATDSSR